MECESTDLLQGGRSCESFDRLAASKRLVTDLLKSFGKNDCLKCCTAKESEVADAEKLLTLELDALGTDFMTIADGW